MRLAAFAFLTTSLLATSYQVTPDIEYSAPGGESLKLDAHGRFSAALAVSAETPGAAVRVTHPSTGIHYYVRHLTP